MSDDFEAMGAAYDSAMSSAAGDAPAPVDEVAAEVPQETQPRTEPEQTDSILDRPRDDKGRFLPSENVEVQEQEGDPSESDADGADTPSPVRAPNYVPQGVQAVWGDIPEAAQQAIAKSQQEMSAKLANMGRQQQAITPILSQLQQATQQFPELANMSPDQLAGDVMELAQTRANLMRDPVNTLIQVATQLGAMPQLVQQLGVQQPQGQQQVPPQAMADQGLAMERIQMQQQIAKLESELRNAVNPDNIAATVQQQMETQRVEASIADFAAQKEHWAEVEGDLPNLIPVAQQILPEGASNEDVLNAAYDMAVDARNLRAQPEPAPAAAPAQGDPRRTAAAIKSNTVNIRSVGGQSAPVSERDAMSAAYDRIMSS